MKNVLAFFLLWIGLTLQATVLQIPPLSAIQLNFDVVLLVLIAMTRGPRVALVLGIAIGFIEDVNYGAFIGLNAFAYGFIGYLAGTILSQLISRSVVSTFLVSLCCTFVYNWLTYGMTRLFDVTSYSWVGVMSVSIEQMMLNGVLTLILYPFAMRWFTNQEKRRYEAK
ncbi:rod shape-determining protein MreD [Alicyclobacillus curvatus]|jgi:rod shape-determining protein MreD|nr:rod shape-determining protein MreD [Alicyclobacillus curvatus]